MKLTSTGHTLKAAASVLLAAVVMFSLAIPAFAASSSSKQPATTVKVAFYPLDGFFEYDENGEPSGYGVDYLNELKKYANLEWEYVPVDSWEGIDALIDSGAVDARMPASESTVASDRYDYTIEPMLTTYHATMTLASRTDLYYQDYEKMGTLKFAVCENLREKTGTEAYLQSIGISDNLVDYPDYNACRAALEAGEVDALISNVMDLTDDMKIIDKFAVTENYITTAKDAPCYTAINDALTELKLTDPSFQADLYQKYFPERAIEPFTKEESRYIALTPQLTVGVYPDRKPVSYVDSDGSYQGIAIDMANTISEKIGIPFKYVTIDTPTTVEMLDRADLVMPMPDNDLDPKYFLTRSIYDTSIMMAVPSTVSELKDGSRIGVVGTMKGISQTLDSLDRFELVEFESGRDACNAVQNGTIDAFASSSYVIDWLLQNPRYADLSPLRYQSFPLAYSLCGKAEDATLQSILGKGISALTDDERNAIIQKDSKLAMDDYTPEDWLYVYRYQVLGAAVILLLLIAFAFVYMRTRERYYRQIEKSSKELEKASEAKSDFLSRMSHDMRTPMNGILGITHLLHDRTDPQEIQADVDQIEMSAKYLLSLINDTLDMSKIESGKMELHPEPIRSEGLFKNVVATASILAQQKGVELKTEFPSIEHGKWVSVVADSSRVEQIFINIISNAIKFTPKGGTVTLHMETIAVTDSVVHDRYVISDTGIGMSKEFQEHLFEPFAQEGREYASSDGGTGLGLAIVKQIVDLMGGSITVQSEIDKGSTFTVELVYPRYKGELKEDETPQVNLSVLSGKRVLLCEDNQVNATIATRLLEQKGVLVEHAVNGEKGVEMFARSAEHYYDAILMDIRMPVMDGIEATKAIRALSNKQDATTVPIIAMTANAFDDDRRETQAAGMNEHLAKPVEPEQLYETLAAFIAGADSSAAAN